MTDTVTSSISIKIFKEGLMFLRVFTCICVTCIKVFGEIYAMTLEVNLHKLFSLTFIKF